MVDILHWVYEFVKRNVKPEITVIWGEQELAEWLLKNHKKLGFDRIIRTDIGRGPDLLMERKGKVLRVELESKLSGYRTHPSGYADVIIACCKDIEFDFGVEVIVPDPLTHKVLPIDMIFHELGLGWFSHYYDIKDVYHIDDLKKEIIKILIRKGVANSKCRQLARKMGVEV